MGGVVEVGVGVGIGMLLVFGRLSSHAPDADTYHDEQASYPIECD